MCRSLIFSVFNESPLWGVDGHQYLCQRYRSSLAATSSLQVTFKKGKFENHCKRGCDFKSVTLPTNYRRITATISVRSLTTPLLIYVLATYEFCWLYHNLWFCGLIKIMSGSIQYYIYPDMTVWHRLFYINFVNHVFTESFMDSLWMSY